MTWTSATSTTSATSSAHAGPASREARRAQEMRDAGYPPPQGQWTYEDYLRFTPEADQRHGFRYEVLEGRLHMAASPNTRHQRILSRLHLVIGNHLVEGDRGEVIQAPMDVILGEDATPVEPDLMVILKDRLHIIKDKFIEGPPNLLIEVLSASTSRVDRQDKHRIYARQGVREYWIVDLEAQVIEVSMLREGAYARGGRYERGRPPGEVRSEVLPDLRLSVEKVFAEVG